MIYTLLLGAYTPSHNLGKKTPRKDEFPYCGVLFINVKYQLNLF